MDTQFTMHVHTMNISRASESSPSEDARTRAAAIYRQRRHISVEDTISLGPDQNSPHAARRQNFAQQVT